MRVLAAGCKAAEVGKRGWVAHWTVYVQAVSTCSCLGYRNNPCSQPPPQARHGSSFRCCPCAIETLPLLCRCYTEDLRVTAAEGAQPVTLAVGASTHLASQRQQQFFGTVTTP